MLNKINLEAEISLKNVDNFISLDRFLCLLGGGEITLFKKKGPIFKCSQNGH
jgi:hypothetical protein